MNYEQAKKELIRILSIDSVESEALPNMPFGKGVYDCLISALDTLSRYGFTVKNGNGYYGYGEIGQGELFGILCHLDVVPVTGEWSFPPFGAVEHDNKIYARGALDDKGPFISTLYALTKLLDEGYVPNKRIRIILGCDEESGWKCMDEYIKNEEMPVLGISPDGDFPVINCEKGIVYHTIRYPKPEKLLSISAGQRANMVPDKAQATVYCSRNITTQCLKKDCTYSIDGDYVTIETSGVSSHGSHPENGDNALIKLLDVLRVDFAFAEDLYKAFSSSDGVGTGLKISDAKSGALTLNLGTANVVDDEIVFELDVRHPVTSTKDFVTDALKSHLFGKVEQGFFHLPLYVDKEHVLVKTLLKAYNKVMKVDAQPISIGGGTYARVLPVGVAFGPCFPNSKANIHCVDEYIDLTEFEKASEIYYEALKELCFSKK